MAAESSQRIDKWLWHARFARTRTAAQRLAVSGHVRINRQKVSTASRLVRPGDVLTLALGRAVVVLTVAAIAERRGSAAVARTLYIQHEPEMPGPGARPEGSGDEDGACGDTPGRPRPEARPGKHQRREAAAIKRRGGF